MESTSTRSTPNLCVVSREISPVLRLRCRYAQYERGLLAAHLSAVRPEPFDGLRTGYTAAGGEVEGRAQRTVLT